MQMLHLQHFLAIYIDVTGETVQDPRAYVSWLFHIVNTIT